MFHPDKLKNPQNVSNVAFLAPSITPLVGHGTSTNPGFRQFSYKKSQNHLENYDQYYADLFKANFVGKIRWEHLYSFKDLYDVTNLSPGNILEVYNKMLHDDDVYQKTYVFNTLLHYNRKYLRQLLA